MAEVRPSPDRGSAASPVDLPEIRAVAAAEAWELALAAPVLSPEPARTNGSGPPAGPPTVSVSGYWPLPRDGWALVLYGQGRVQSAVAGFADGLSAELYAMDSGFRSYDVVPARLVAHRPP